MPAMCKLNSSICSFICFTLQRERILWFHAQMTCPCLFIRFNSCWNTWNVIWRESNCLKHVIESVLNWMNSLAAVEFFCKVIAACNHMYFTLATACRLQSMQQISLLTIKRIDCSQIECSLSSNALRTIEMWRHVCPHSRSISVFVNQIFFVSSPFHSIGPFHTGNHIFTRATKKLKQIDFHRKLGYSSNNRCYHWCHLDLNERKCTHFWIKFPLLWTFRYSSVISFIFFLLQLLSHYLNKFFLDSFFFPLFNFRYVCYRNVFSQAN